MVSNWARNLAAVIIEPEWPPQSKAIPLPEAVEQARREWQSAQHYYDAVSDSDLVDYAVYMLQAAEKKYSYLLKTARREGVTHSPYRAES